MPQMLFIINLKFSKVSLEILELQFIPLKKIKININ